VDITEHIQTLEQERQAKRDGRAQPLASTYLVAIKEETQKGPTCRDRVGCNET
jgi:hypothetical protein